MKNVLTVLLAVTVFSLLVLATKTYSDGAPPDLLSVECVDTSDRSFVRAQRDMCDNDATRRGFNLGVFRPHNENTDGPAHMCPTGSTAFSCLGTPHLDCFPPDCGD